MGVLVFCYFWNKRPQGEMAVKFLGYTNDSQGFWALFEITNGLATAVVINKETVTFEGTNGLASSYVVKSTGILDPLSRGIVRKSVETTNGISSLQLNCTLFEPVSRFQLRTFYLLKWFSEEIVVYWPEESLVVNSH